MTRKSKPIDLRGKSVQEQADSILATLKARPTTKRPKSRKACPINRLIAKEARECDRINRTTKPRTKRADGAEKLVAHLNRVFNLSNIEKRRYRTRIRRYASHAVAAERKRACEAVKSIPATEVSLQRVLAAIRNPKVR